MNEFCDQPNSSELKIFTNSTKTSSDYIKDDNIKLCMTRQKIFRKLKPELSEAIGGVLGHHGN